MCTDLFFQIFTDDPQKWPYENIIYNIIRKFFFRISSSDNVGLTKETVLNILCTVDIYSSQFLKFPLKRPTLQLDPFSKSTLLHILYLIEKMRSFLRLSGVILIGFLDSYGEKIWEESLHNFIFFGKSWYNWKNLVINWFKKIPLLVAWEWAILTYRDCIWNIFLLSARSAKVGNTCKKSYLFLFILYRGYL